MLNSNKFQNTLYKKIRALGTSRSIYGWSNSTSISNQNHDSETPQSLEQRIADKNVAIFWDLDNKPPKEFPPYDAALRLKKAAQQFGFVKYMIAYANRHAFSYVPPAIKSQRKERKSLNQLENKGIVMPHEPYVCRVCGRRFYNNERFNNHFRQIHEREQMKRLNQIESARGKRRLNLVARYAVKMEKYRNAVRDVLTPKVGYRLADELKRAGFWVKTVSDKPQAADVELRSRMVDMMDRGMVECLVLVSDDSDFLEILKEVRLRCLKTVVVSDINDGALKRAADAAFSWQAIMIGKAKKEAISAVGKWKDRNVLQNLEWTYGPERDKRVYFNEIESDDDSGIDFLSSDESGSLLEKESNGAWWELEPSEDVRRPSGMTEVNSTTRDIST
ncbi:zinc finger family protein [Perilla frutescens var. hirtella]|nr:zinc finger family protein [Perilla frutescens var. hirtella]